MNRELKSIRAFGACMIGGYPHPYEDSFFHLAMERLRNEAGHDIVPSISTLGGFPVTRVLKHLQPRCLAANPDIVVVQFGSTDLIVRTKPHRQESQRKVSTASAGVFDRLRWCICGIVGDVLQLGPVTPPEIYLETMGRMVRAISEHGAIPVVLSPFVIGGARSDRIARNCAPRLQEIVNAIPGACYVNVYSALAEHSRGQMLLCDGSHLSLKGHAVVAASLYASLAEVLACPMPPTRRI